MDIKYIFILIFFSFWLVHCSSLKTGKQDLLSVPETLNKDNDSSFRSNPDSVYVFTCNERKYSLKGNKISRAYFPFDLRNCLLENGYRGDEKANKQIATIINNTRFNDLLIFGGSDAVYRGPTVFGAFLKKSQNYRPLNTFDDGEDSIYEMGTVSDVYIGYYCRMIKSIDGWDPYAYIENSVKYGKIMVNDYGEDGLFNPAYGIEVGRKTHKAIIKAWQEGEIIFKEYIEE